MHSLLTGVDVEQSDADLLLEHEEADMRVTCGDMLDADVPWSSPFEVFRGYGAGDGSWWGRAPEWALS
jgi:hypothetical protein